MLSGGAGAVLAQVAPKLPSGAEPGRESPKPVLPEPSLSAPRVDVPRGTASQAPSGAASASFVLKEMVIDGATAFDAASLRPLYADLLGRTITVADAFAVANALELRYRNAGYVTTRVVVPEQTVDDGRFRIVVVEGFVSDIVYDGDIGAARAAVERLLTPLRDVRPISVARIERQLLLANDLPGLAVHASMTPSPTAVGGSVVSVHVERQATQASASVDNRGSAYLGRAEAAASLDWNAFAGRADHLSFGVKASASVDRSSAVSASYDALVADNGLTAGFLASYARSHPGLELDALDVRSGVSSAIGTLTYPLIRSREQNLRVVGQLDVRDVNTDIAAAEFTRDRLRILRVGLSYDRSDDWNGVTAVRATLHQGLSGFGATKEGSALASRAHGRSDFLKLTLDVTRLQQVSERVSLAATATGQFTNDALLASEEIGLGGASFGRAYDDGEISGDNGVAGSLELRYAASLPHPLPAAAQFYGYLDGGRAWASHDGAQVARPALSSFGAGVRANVTHGLLASLEVAKPMSAVVKTQDDKHARVFVSLSTQF